MSRRLTRLLLVGAAIVVVGCGSSTKTVVQTVTAPATTLTTATPTATATTNAAESAPPNCQHLPNAPTFEGNCVVNGATFLFENKGDTARLKSLAVKINGTSTAQSYSAGGGATSATARGTFVTVNVTVTNRLDSPQQFDESDTGQVQLQVRQATYTPSFEAENQADQKSFLSANLEPLQPGESQSGDVVFDVPTSRVATALNHGAIVVVDFGSTVSTTTTAALLKLF
jgi:hypothetical protein